MTIGDKLKDAKAALTGNKSTNTTHDTTVSSISLINPLKNCVPAFATLRQTLCADSGLDLCMPVSSLFARQNLL